MIYDFVLLAESAATQIERAAFDMEAIGCKCKRDALDLHASDCLAVTIAKEYIRFAKLLRRRAKEIADRYSQRVDDQE